MTATGAAGNQLLHVIEIQRYFDARRRRPALRAVLTGLEWRGAVVFDVEVGVVLIDSARCTEAEWHATAGSAPWRQPGEAVSDSGDDPTPA